ncbi:MAG: gamma-glutamylcyclotransferase [Peptococcaceae bacterium]|nr:gamma-glutamylcyclotransferase [Peptococcaceae bacterium]
MNSLTLPDSETVVLGIIRDADHAPAYDLILKRSGFSAGQLDDLIGRLVDRKKITTFPGDSDKRKEVRRYLTVPETGEAVDREIAAHLWEMSAGGLLYFAYGSDLDPEEMYKKRCPGSRFLCRGSLEGFDLVFDQYLEEWRGTLCSIKFSGDENRVWGVLYGVQAGHWQTLDSLENAPELNRRVRVPVRTAFGLFCAGCYQSVPGNRGLPSESYLEKMIRGAEFFGLPQKYIRMIKSLPAQGRKIDRKEGK